MNKLHSKKSLYFQGEQIHNVYMFGFKPKPKPPIDLRGALVAFTGRFDFGERVKCVNALESRGGVHAGRTVYYDTKYVVVGNKGSGTWSTPDAGQKLIAAKKHQKKSHGRTCRIITEDEWMQAVLSI